MKTLSDIATEAHTQIQQNCPDINPVVGVNQGMRASGFPADIMTIDCLKTNKRIILILHDDSPELVRYQFSFRDQDPADEFKDIALKDISATLLYDWMIAYFSSPTRQ
jgi:hypothetical protein